MRSLSLNLTAVWGLLKAVEFTVVSSEPIKKVYLVIGSWFVGGIHMSAHKWAMLLLVSLLVLTSVCAVASAQSTGGAVKIKSPSENGKAGPTQPVSGTAQLAKGYSLWIVPHDPTTGIYYPQASPVTVGIDATWSTRLSVGSTFGVGKTFQIQAVIADPSASSALSAGAAQRTGIAKLPSGAQVFDSVTVTRAATNVAGSASATPSPTALLTTSAATSSTATANPSTTNVVQVSSAAKSQNPLPGFEALYGFGALATIFLALYWTRQRRGG
jgi:hypothetical protein